TRNPGTRTVEDWRKSVFMGPGLRRDDFILAEYGAKNLRAKHPRSFLPSIRIFVVDALEVAAPPRLVIPQHLRGRGAGAGDREEGVQEMRLVLAGRIAAGAAVKAAMREIEHLEGEVLERTAAERRCEAEPRHVAAHRLALLLGPVGDKRGGGVE